MVRPKDIYAIVEASGAEGHGLKASRRLLGVGVGVLALAGMVPVRARCAPGLPRHT